MKNEFRVDLHTHSTTSFDGGISADQYTQALRENPNLVIAVTDHNEISFALELQKKLGDRIIVGEEILTQEGEVIGLYLTQAIEPGLTALETIQKIKEQDGLVYIPHPFENTRKGLDLETLRAHAILIDIVEVFNARSKEVWLSDKIQQAATDLNLAGTASSDAHGARGLGASYALVASRPSKHNLVELLKHGSLIMQRAPFLSFLDPLRNKIKKIFS